MKEHYTIYSWRLAGYLLFNGFYLEKKFKNKKTSKDNFVFKNSDALQDCIDEYKIKKLEWDYNKKTKKSKER